MVMGQGGIRAWLVGGLAVATFTVMAPVCGASSGGAAGLPASNGPAKVPGIVYGRSLTGRYASFRLVPAFVTLPENMPNTSITVQLPLFPKSFLSMRPFSLAYQSTPQTPYVVVGGNNYIVKTSRAFAETWYGRQFNAAGYVLTGEATMGDFKTGQSSDGFTYTSRRHPTLAVDVSFEALAPKRTLVRYWVKDVLTPSQTLVSLLPVNTTSIQVQYTRSAGRAPTVVTITNPRMIRDWIRSIGSLRVDTRDVQCAADNRGSALLTFTDALGKVSVVKVDSMCGQVTLPDYPPLQDKGIWRLVLQTIHHP